MTEEIEKKTTETTELAAPENMEIAAAMNSIPQLEQAAKIGEIMATAKVAVPNHLRSNAGDCTAIALQALQWGMNPFAVAQKTHIVNGALGYESQLVNAVIRQSGALRTAPDFEPIGDWDKYRESAFAASAEKGCGVTVRAVLRGEIEPREKTLYMDNVKTRNSPLWKTDPYQQLCYLALKYFARLYAPGAILGVYTPDELAEQTLTNITESQPDEIKPKKSPKGAAARLAARLNMPAEAETVEAKPDYVGAIEAALRESGAPVTMAEVEKWLISGGVLPDGKTLAADWESLNQAWKKRMEEDPAAFVKVATEKMLTK